MSSDKNPLDMFPPPYWQSLSVRLYQADAKEQLPRFPDNAVHCIVTSPPYYQLRRYAQSGQDVVNREIGREESEEEHIAQLVALFREARRVLREDGVLWLNYGEKYAVNARGEAELTGLPWKLAFALQSDGWRFRVALPWFKFNPRPESATDRPSVAHEYLFLFGKGGRYWYDGFAVKRELAPASLDRARYGLHILRPEGGGQSISVAKMGERFVNPLGRNHRSIDTALDALQEEKERIERILQRQEPFPCGWDGHPAGFFLSAEPSRVEHYAAFPNRLARFCILSSAPPLACMACGRGYQPEIERQNGRRKLSRRRTAPGKKQETFAKRPAPVESDMFFVTGYEPDCECDAGSLPGVVLDPFAGSGTTLVAAQNLGRYSVGIELEPEYIRIIQERAGQESLF